VIFRRIHCEPLDEKGIRVGAHHYGRRVWKLLGIQSWFN
jgi:hypothetical protein